MDGIVDYQIRTFLLAKEKNPILSSLPSSDSIRDIEAYCRIEAAIKFTKGAIVNIRGGNHELQERANPTTVFPYDHFWREK